MSNEIGRCETHQRELIERDEKCMTPEQKWCGTWYDCPEPNCFRSTLVMSAELKAFLKKFYDEALPLARITYLKRKDGSSSEMVRVAVSYDNKNYWTALGETGNKDYSKSEWKESTKTEVKRLETAYKK